MAFTVERTQTGTAYGTFSVADVPTNPTGLTVRIYKDGTEIIAATTPTNIEVGYYYYAFAVPTAWELGWYSVLWEGVLNGISFQQEEPFEVILTQTDTGTDLPSGTYCALGDITNVMAQVDLSGMPEIATRMTEYIYDAQDEVDRLCGQSFKEYTETVYLDGSGGVDLILPRKPVTEVSSCVVRLSANTAWITFSNIVYINCRMSDGTLIRTASTDTEVLASDLLVDVRDGRLRVPESDVVVASSAWPGMGYRFIEGISNIKVTYTAGYDSDSYPRRVKRMAALIAVKEFLLRKSDRDAGGMTSLNVDGAGRNWGGIPYQGRLAFLEAEIEKIAEFYRPIEVSV